MPKTQEQIARESDKEMGVFLKGLATVIKNIPFFGVKLASYLTARSSHSLFSSFAERPPVDQAESIHRALKKDPFAVRNVKNK